jgi:hypothetical protein
MVQGLKLVSEMRYENLDWIDLIVVWSWGRFYGHGKKNSVLPTAGHITATRLQILETEILNREANKDNRKHYQNKKKPMENNSITR